MASSSPRARSANWASKRLALLVRVVELGEGVADLEAADVELKALNPVGLVGLLLGEGRDGEGEVVDDGGLDEVRFGQVLEKCRDCFARTSSPCNQFKIAKV